MMTKKNLVYLVVILAIAAFLRFYRLSDFMIFGIDEGRDLLVARDIIIHKKFPLLGPPTSLGWFRLGAFVYYLWSVVLYLARFNPISIAFVTGLFDVIAVYLMFLLGKEMFNKKVGFLASILYAVSPLAIIWSRTPLHVSLSPFFASLFLFFLVKFILRSHLERSFSLRRSDFYICCFLLGIIVQVHFTGIVLCIIFAILAFGKVKFKNAVVGVFLALLPLAPFLGSEVKSGFITSKRLILWFPYRTLSSIGFFTEKNILTLFRIKDVLNALSSMLQKSIFVAGKEVSVVVFITAIVVSFRSIKKVLLTFLVIYLIAILIHGQPAEHYFLFLLPIIVLMTAFLLSRIRLVGLLAVTLIAVINICFLLKNNFYIAIPFSELKQITKSVIHDSGNRSYQIIAPPDFTGPFAKYSNFKYLTWWLGKEFVDKNPEIIYMVYLRKDNIAPLKGGQERIEFANSIIVKSR